MTPLGIDHSQMASADPVIAGVRMAMLVELTDDDRSAWARLTAENAADSIYAADWFVRALLENFDPENQARLFIAVNPLGDWDGVAVLTAEKWLGRVPLSHWSGFANPNLFLGVPLVRRGREEAFWRALLPALDCAGTGQAALALTDCPADHRTTRALLSLCAAEGREFEVLMRRERAALVASSDMKAAMDKGLSSKRLSRLRSLERKIERDHGPLRCVSAESAEDIEAWIDSFLSIEASGWKGRAGSALACAEDTAALFRSAVREGHAHGAICCMSLKMGERTLAMTSYFASKGHGFGFKCCFDEAFASYAPGILLLRKIMMTAGDGRPLAFDSCSSHDETTINALWLERREMIDLCVGLQSHLGDTRRAGALAARRWWHHLKVARKINLYPV